MAKKSQPSGRQILAAAGAAAAYYVFLRPQLLKWHTHPSVAEHPLPGDEVITQPNLQLTQAIGIDAPADAIWPWLAQMGRERSGYYVCDWLVNHGVPSMGFVRRDMPSPEAGMSMDGGFHVIQAEPSNVLLFGAFSVNRWIATVDTTSLYVLKPREHGGTWLIMRQREYAFGLMRQIYSLLMEPVYALGMHQQLARLKALSERSMS
ncbi:MAG TPA: SRPBCC family protein [Aggregatilinea sp.]|uniref:SRPBCC family protein n=1 Tax=Aggregatilinea sp. TaxID=2806333 RepID=UPI002B6A1EA8|nr:SRPBCC family protein [Aggregatilinea sp.]HML20100.1 SRPBCC family protein [Aggregatilinea sp.]